MLTLLLYSFRASWTMHLSSYIAGTTIYGTKVENTCQISTFHPEFIHPNRPVTVHILGDCLVSVFILFDFVQVLLGCKCYTTNIFLPYWFDGLLSNSILFFLVFLGYTHWNTTNILLPYWFDGVLN